MMNFKENVANRLIFNGSEKIGVSTLIEGSNEKLRDNLFECIALKDLQKKDVTDFELVDGDDSLDSVSLSIGFQCGVLSCLALLGKTLKDIEK